MARLTVVSRNSGPDFDQLLASNGRPDDTLLDRLVIGDPEQLALLRDTTLASMGDLPLTSVELDEASVLVEAIDRAFWRAERPGERYVSDEEFARQFATESRRSRRTREARAVTTIYPNRA